MSKVDVPSTDAKQCGCVRYWCWRCAGKWNNRRYSYTNKG